MSWFAAFSASSSCLSDSGSGSAMPMTCSASLPQLFATGCISDVSSGSAFVSTATPPEISACTLVTLGDILIAPLATYCGLRLLDPLALRLVPDPLVKLTSVFVRLNTAFGGSFQCPFALVFDALKFKYFSPLTASPLSLCVSPESACLIDGGLDVGGRVGAVGGCGLGCG
ncbi:hypothetical protein AYI70_g6290 [Smittium culicis]|uniref:Uncharacterized protein n=1 Tax=Smittium culicis TaxID=133412 RepID=A0A1R1XQR2_9FUNG|nr:hypothetical protein AYI70_g8635 [Smittium culicis]OMJ16934.1 hypothetical protein AYI70_g6290 [Smittium culicis]